MAVYFVTGNLGAGKGLAALDRISNYLFEGRRVATNLNLWLENLLPPSDKQSVVRVPDRPRLCDLEMLGRGHDEEKPNDKKNGLLVLDECLDWLNSRDWRDKERTKIMSWFRHARKHRWDVMFIAQDMEALDKQLVQSLCEFFVQVRRTDRLRFGPFRLPKAHIANVHYGKSRMGAVSDRWTFTGRSYYDAYDTEQVFEEDLLLVEKDDQYQEIDFRAPYSMLSAWHLKGRYLPPDKPSIAFSRIFCLVPWVVAFVVCKAVPPLKRHFSYR